MKKQTKLLIVLIVLFIIDAIFVLTNCTNTVDTIVYKAIRSINNGFFDNYFKFITVFGNTNVVLLILAVLNMRLVRRDVIKCNLVVFLSVLSNLIIKNIICRSRPSVLHLIKQGGYSFPSGHSMISICLYGYLFYLVNKRISNVKYKRLLEVLLIILISSICISRIYLGVHYFTDVVGGIILALAILVFVIYLDNRLLVVKRRV